MSADRVTLNFGTGMVATMSGVRQRAFDATGQKSKKYRRHIRRIEKASVIIWGITNRHSEFDMIRDPMGIFQLDHASRLKIRDPNHVSNDHFKMFALDIGKFVRNTSAYDISGRPFSSLDDGTVWTGADTPSGHWPADPRLDKVKRFLRRHLHQGEPTDKDVDTFIYMYFGSNAFREEYESGGHYFTVSKTVITIETGGIGGATLPVMISKLIALRHEETSAESLVEAMVGPHGYGEYSNTRNSNSTDSNNSNSNGNNRPTSAQYMQNKSRVKTNKIKNKSYKNSIEWEEHTVNNLPEDLISFEPFSNGQKAIKIDKYNRYYSPQTFRTQARMSMTDAFNKNGNAVLFKHPMTRQNVRRSNIKFVVLKNKNTGRATKAKKNAANKIGDARRRQLTRRSTLARAKAAAAALKRKRSQ